MGSRSMESPNLKSISSAARKFELPIPILQTHM